MIFLSFQKPLSCILNGPVDICIGSLVEIDQAIFSPALHKDIL